MCHINRTAESEGVLTKPAAYLIFNSDATRQLSVLRKDRHQKDKQISSKSFDQRLSVLD